MKRAAIIIGAALLPFAAGAFTAWEIDPSQWTHEGRGMTSMFAAIAAGFAAIITD